MPTKLDLREFLEALNETARRVRYSAILVVVVSVLLFSGLLNSIVHHSWIQNRISFSQRRLLTAELELQRLETESTGINPSSSSEPSIPSAVPTPTPTFAEYVDGYTLGKLRYQPDLPNDMPKCGGGTTCSQRPTVTEKKLCLECSRKSAEFLLLSLIRAEVENVVLIRVPFFGVAFDINDLGLIGGISLLLMLIILRLSLRSYIVGLRISIKACISRDKLTQLEREIFYETLAARQLFVFPRLGDDLQSYSSGYTESLWAQSSVRKVYARVIGFLSWVYSVLKRSGQGLVSLCFNGSGKGWAAAFLFAALIMFTPLLILAYTYESGSAAGSFSLRLSMTAAYILSGILLTTLIISHSKNLSRSRASQGAGNKTANESIGQRVWRNNPQPWLSRTSKIISLIPFAVYLMVVVHDYLSLDVGLAVDYWRAFIGFTLSVIFLIGIFALGLWCISKWYEINRLWEKFHKDVFEPKKAAKGHGENLYTLWVWP